ncbi:hypothetical protein [Mycobacterium sp. OTB74]|uniref:hypothetical protein n=1 Tax=Mycobacterium sp. OTB74 TaxID=1853452 RepID=UPI002474B8C5|nr:hypothetical protein [Mycobacterium sp. OTB74]
MVRQDRGPLSGPGIWAHAAPPDRRGGRAARCRLGLLGVVGSSTLTVGLTRLDSLGVLHCGPHAPSVSVRWIGGGDVQRAGSGAGEWLRIEVAAGVGDVAAVVADVLCGVGGANGDVVIGEEPAPVMM